MSVPETPPGSLPPAYLLEEIPPDEVGVRWVRLGPPLRRRRRVWLHALLFVLTALTTTWAGSFHYAGFLADFGGRTPSLGLLDGVLGGLWYSLSILAILGAHEMGHYLAARHYGVDATLPFFLPVPAIIVFTGTLGAFIKIRGPIQAKPVLFDIGIAGPIAGFIVAVPALFVGLALSRIAAIPQDFVGFELGEPLLFRLAAWLLWGPVPAGYSLNLHPMAFAAWFGLLATALNLLPIGQLDGGHISYAALGRRSTTVTLAALAGVSALTVFVSLSWLVWTLLLLVMLGVFGPRHPRTLDEDIPLDRTRRLLAVVALVILVLCFTPAPIEPIGN